ncbi:MAG TPA: hypothetical protein VLV78_04385 [Thermoanaerobaculia bacterium]|nr:hypothetical protein [Thermoanaerobaculia bacterium]
MHAGETAHVRNGDNHLVLTYRGFASVVSIVAALVAAIVIVTGVAATLFLIEEHRAGPAIAALVLSVVFSALIAALVPRVRVTLYSGAAPALVIVQQSPVAFPRVKYIVQTADGSTIAILRKSVISRLGRNTWSIDAPPDQRAAGFAVEESLWRAIVRKFIGKFNRKREANVRLYYQGIASGLIVRRPDATGEADYLDLAANATLDRRVAVALATLVFGAEP